ncbi:DUF2922 domain-containing protein [Clostridium mediterraneense]|uniref:DUF2922 domain-containing protein n=1 Tax=Clostridium mediterraneense TaxID=1805472 RepID=UPI00082FFFF5|nr:DUF2922 domain-containing protein [Clostridium mediterraneense]
MAKIFTLIMSFKNEEGKTCNISLKNVKPILSAQDTKAAMDLIIEKDLFVTSGGSLVSAISAEIVEKTTTELEIA